MQRPHRSRGAKSSGFSLIELMVTLVVASILVAIAIPSYTTQVRKSRRTDAKTALRDLAAREERYANTNNGAYTTVVANLGYSGTFPVTVGNGYYAVAAPVVTNASATAVATYTITAAPLAGIDQAKDICTSFTVLSNGTQTATGTSANPSVDCWQ